VRTLATPGLLAITRNASLCVRRAGIPIASPSSRARSSDTIGIRAVIIALLNGFPGVLQGGPAPRNTRLSGLTPQALTPPIRIWVICEQWWVDRAFRAGEVRNGRNG